MPEDQICIPIEKRPSNWCRGRISFSTVLAHWVCPPHEGTEDNHLSQLDSAWDGANQGKTNLDANSKGIKPVGNIRCSPVRSSYECTYKQVTEFQKHLLTMNYSVFKCIKLNDVKKSPVRFTGTYEENLIESKENQHLDCQEFRKRSSTA